MNIFFREIKANLKSLFIWSIIVFAFMSIGMAKFSAYHGNPEMLEILDSMPPALLEAFGMKAFNLTTVSGFFGVMFTYFALMGTISAAMLGSDIISKEERDKTVEFSLTMPVTRSKLITSKILAGVVYCIGLLLVMWGTSIVSVAKYKPDAQFYEYLSLLMVTLFIMQMLFLAVGIFLGCAMKYYRRASSTAVMLLLGTYFLSIIVGLSDKLDFLKYFSPFMYFSSVKVFQTLEIDMNYVFLSLGIIVVSLIGGYVTYSKRDLYI